MTVGSGEEHRGFCEEQDHWRVEKRVLEAVDNPQSGLKVVAHLPPNLRHVIPMNRGNDVHPAIWNLIISKLADIRRVIQGKLERGEIRGEITQWVLRKTTRDLARAMRDRYTRTKSLDFLGQPTMDMLQYALSAAKGRDKLIDQFDQELDLDMYLDMYVDWAIIEVRTKDGP